MHTYAYIHACIHRYLPSYLPTHIHTYIHTIQYMNWFMFIQTFVRLMKIYKTYHCFLPFWLAMFPKKKPAENGLPVSPGRWQRKTTEVWMGRLWAGKKLWNSHLWSNQQCTTTTEKYRRNFQGLGGVWFLKLGGGNSNYFFYVHPDFLGEWSKLTSRFFKWVGSTTNEKGVDFQGMGPQNGWVL